ncbi:Type II/IV secretion system protein TadC, associated with Flp pilus assembly [Labilithrix luteola]|uniref:Type II/IV secretion system protein TadC, associated with Flp pilus assembly n=1 Tax=Labilithrix luteola TaxID=1391654 RepID=A0A0K1PKK9_9BACT|nr:type II secretion system F family protein [Labilithrix luteola]AKU94073.1 Type II/IV secretion system protein TadC, associated with Flp pilus assembly [Labilithrix luteola]
MRYEYLRYAAVAVLACGLFVMIYLVAGAPSREASRLGMRGLKRQRAIQNGSGWSTIEPLVRWLGVRVSGAMSDELHASMDRQLTLAGDFYGLTPPEYVALSILSGIAGTVFGALVATVTKMPLLAVICLGFGAGGPYLVISGEVTERVKRVTRGLPYAVDLMALAMGAGLDFPGAIRQVVEKSSDPNDPLTEELAWMLQKMQLGHTRRQVLHDLALRIPVASVTEFVSAITQADERGNPVAAVLAIQASSSRQRRSVKAEEGAAKAGVAMSLPLVFVFICILILIMAPIALRLSQSSLASG